VVVGLPAECAPGRPISRSGEPVLFLNNPDGQSTADRRRVLDTVQQLNQAQLAEVGDPEIGTRSASTKWRFACRRPCPS
jgi:hypothetical protein